MFNRLKAYKKENLDCLVPAQYQKDKPLGFWVRTQRAKLKDGSLTKERKAKLDSIGFAWYVKPDRDDVWNSMFEKLQAYQRDHGDCLVPQLYSKDTTLGNWVTTQRSNNKANFLTPERKEKLDSIGFVWYVKPDRDDEWNRMYKKLKYYALEKGDCLVPQQYTEDPHLGLWVSTQRRSYRANTMTQKRKSNLDSIGFVWKAKVDSDEQWNSMLQQLQAYKQTHGDTLVPFEYEENPALGFWVARQRRNNNAKELTKERKAQLESIGFSWDTSTEWDAQWNRMFEKLQAYQRDHGNCLVPQLYTKDTSLGIWVAAQRKNNKIKALTAERKAKLDSVGFAWYVKPDRDDEWNRMLGKLKAYKQQHGNCLVPRRYAQDKLGLWVGNVRARNRDNLLTSEQKLELDGIGFIWKVKLDPDDQWNIMFERLKDYKDRMGDCLVPQKYPEDKALGVWVASQRSSNKANTLTEERKEKLDSIGFVWRLKDRPSSTEITRRAQISPKRMSM